MARIAVLQHFECENEGIFGAALREAGHALTRVPLYGGAPVPGPDDYEAWLVMGGPMNVDDTDKHAYLTPERALLVELIRRDAPVLGICLGCQLLARAAGARVYAQRPKEIGLFPIERTLGSDSDPLFAALPRELEVFQWHGDTYDMPEGAVQLARSHRYEQQAFRLGRRVYGLQFHLECTMDIVQNLVHVCADELAALPEEDRFEQYRNRLEPALARQNQQARELVQRWNTLFQNDDI